MSWRETDPEFTERLEHFMYEETVQEEGQQLDDATRHTAILATLLGCQGLEEFRCEPQLTAHARGNMNMGNDKEFLIRVVSQCLPYIGYPRSLNALTCIHRAAEAGN